MKESSSTSSEFRERVKKTFGNLLTSSVSPNSPTQTWSLPGTQIEKRLWRRDEDSSVRDNIPSSSSFLDSDDWSLSRSIGLDSTLDNEDEEDAYDKVALGRENASDRLYMGAVANKNVPSFVSPDDLSPGNGVRLRDPRANHLAAKIRLKEDDAEVGAEAGQHKTTQDPPTSAEKEHISLARDVALVKPILKRKEQQNSTSKSTKRVKFDPEFVKEGNSGSRIPSHGRTSVDQSALDDRVSRVPDYVRNPSKYTCYSLDSCDETNDESMRKNSQASGSQSVKKDDLTDLPKSIPFVPKKKPDCVKADDGTCESANTGDSDLKNSSAKSTLATGFIDGNVVEPEVGDMEVEEPEKSDIPSSKKDRQYRAKHQTDEPE